MSEIKKSYYAIIPANVRYDKRLSPITRLLYGEITALCNEKGYCWAGNAYFAELYEMNSKSISRCISQLKDCGYIEIELKYKDGSKEVGSRYIRLCGGVSTELLPPIHENVTTPIPENVTDNITVFNTTKNSTAGDSELQKKFDLIWNLYPRKEGKKEAFRHFKASVKSDSDWANIEIAVKNYVQSLKNKNTPSQYWKQGSTFFNNWQEWVSPDENMMGKSVILQDEGKKGMYNKL